MSKAPWPDRLNRITRSSFASRAASASSMAPLIACADSGAGTIPWVLANWIAASKHLILRVGGGLHVPLVHEHATTSSAPP